MKMFKPISNLLLASALLGSGLKLHAQTDLYTGPASGGEWNTAANWSLLNVPGAATNVLILANTNVSYNTPMTASSIGILSQYGVLNINTNGFVVGASGNTAVMVSSNSARLQINNGGAFSVTSGGMVLSNAAALSVSAGGSLTLSGTLFVGSIASGNNPLKDGFFTNNSGVVKVGGMRVSPNGQNANCRAVINGGTNDLGDVIVSRSNLGSFGAPGVEGFLIYGGLVRMTSLNIGNSAAAGNSFLTTYMADGIVTNTGSFTMIQGSASRMSRFVQAGGLFVSTGTNIHLRGGSANVFVNYSVTGGTNIVQGFLHGDTGDTAGTLFFTNAAKIYVGSYGFSNIPLSAVNVSLNNGGVFGATADWTATVPMALAGAFTFNTADFDGTAHNIALNGVLSGGGSPSLTKTGNGSLTFNGANTYLGDTLVNAGTLAVGASGGLSGSGRIVLASGTTFDVSAVSGFTHAASKTLAGWGVITGDVAVASSAIIDPGTNGATGTLSFSNSLTMSGGARAHFDLSSNPSGPNNDLIVIQSDLNVSGSNVVEITGGGPANSVHPLFKYSGNLNGDITNLTIIGPTGTLTNITTSTPKMIAFIPVSVIRSATNVVWVGNAGANDWDTLNLTNWLNGTALDYFVGNDNAFFTAVGAANPNVNFPGFVSPNSVTVNSATDYAFVGVGGITGSSTLTKTNSGRLTIDNINQFTGGVNLKGGTISVANLADDGTDSPLGKSGTILVDGGTLDYTGLNYTWTRSFNLGSTGVMSVTNPATTLTLIGSVGGTGALTKTGNGTLILGGGNGFSGGTVLNAGTLTITNASGAGTGTINLNAGTLVIGAVKPANTINITNNALIFGGNSAGNSGIRNVVGSSNLVVGVSGGTTFDLTGDMGAYSGTITLSNAGGAFVRFNGSIGSPLATWNLATSPMEINIRSASTSNNLGALQGVVGTTINGRTGSGNNGSTTYYIGGNNANATFDGIIQNSGANAVAIVKVGSGTQALSGGNTYTGSTTVSAGTVALIGSGSLASPTIDIRSGAFVDVSGLSTPTLSLSSQTLKGNGTVNGSVDGSGTISPGASIGTLTITNIATLGGTLYVELNRTNGAQTNDILAASSIILGGTLTVTNLGPNLVAGDRFVLFNGSISSSFSTVNLPENLGNVTYTWTNKTDIDGSIQVLTVVTVNQTPTNLVTSVSGNTLTLSWPTDHIGWRLQAQTNALSTGLGSSWTDVDNTSTTNSVDITLNPANGAVFYRMVYP